LELLRPVFENESILKIGQNIKYDLLVLKNYGIEVKGTLYDTLLAHYLIEPEGKHGMDWLAQQYLQYKPVSITELIGKKGKGQGNMRDVDEDEVTAYASEDADITLRLKGKLDPILLSNGLKKLVEEVENPLIPVLTDMEFEGVRIDTGSLAELSVSLEQESKEIEKRVYELAGVRFNLASPKQLGEVLFEKLKLDPKAKKTKTGQYATGEEIVSKLADEHEIAQLAFGRRHSPSHREHVGLADRVDLQRLHLAIDAKHRRHATRKPQFCRAVVDGGFEQPIDRRGCSRTGRWWRCGGHGERSWWCRCPPVLCLPLPRKVTPSNRRSVAPRGSSDAQPC
jgi:hypothetical protein